MPDSDVQAAIAELRAAFAEAENRGDPSVQLAHRDRDEYKRMPPGRPSMDYEEAARSLKTLYEEVDVDVEWESDGVLASGDLAVDSGTFTLDIQGVAGNRRRFGDWLMVFRRDEDGRWKVVRDMYNWNDSATGSETR